MYLSRISLQLSAPGVRQALRNCQDMHRTLMKAFDCRRDEASLIYRLIKNDQSIFIYAQSLVKPQWDRIEAYGFHCEKMQDISALLDTFRAQMVLSFSLLACPAKKVKGEGKNSKRILLRGAEERAAWLCQQGEKYGFEVMEVHEAAKEQTLFGTKASGDFHLAGVPFEGVLRVTDANLFCQAFQHGIGSEKAYGFGMLMIKKAYNE